MSAYEAKQLEKTFQKFCAEICNRRCRIRARANLRVMLASLGRYLRVKDTALILNFPTAEKALKEKLGFFVNKLSVKKSNAAKDFISQDEKLLASEGVLETTIATTTITTVYSICK